MRQAKSSPTYTKYYMYSGLTFSHNVYCVFDRFNCDQSILQWYLLMCQVVFISFSILLFTFNGFSYIVASRCTYMQEDISVHQPPIKLKLQARISSICFDKSVFFFFLLTKLFFLIILIFLSFKRSFIYIFKSKIYCKLYDFIYRRLQK